MSGISYQHLITTTQTGDLILYCDHIPSTRRTVYSLVVMVIRDPTYLNQYLTGTFVISSNPRNIANINTVIAPISVINSIIP